MTLAELAADHPYYCATDNYFSNDCCFPYDDWSSFFAEMGNMDKDYNFLFRWDIKERINDNDELQGYSMELFFMQQRKGRFVSCTITKVTETDVPAIIEYLTGYYNYMKTMWQPIADTK